MKMFVMILPAMALVGCHSQKTVEMQTLQAVELTEHSCDSIARIDSIFENIDIVMEQPCLEIIDTHGNKLTVNGSQLHFNRKSEQVKRESINRTDEVAESRATAEKELQRQSTGTSPYKFLIALALSALAGLIVGLKILGRRL